MEYIQYVEDSYSCFTLTLCHTCRAHSAVNQ